MALTTSKQPVVRTPAYNDQWVIGVSNQIGISDFYYQIEVIVNGSSAGIEKILKRPDGTYNFNAKEKVKNYIKHYFNPNETIIVEAVNKAVAVSVQITEFYSGLLRPADKVIINYTAFDAALKELDFLAYNKVTYTDSNILAEQTLNVSDSIVDPTTDLYIHFFGNTLTKISLVVNDGMSYDRAMPAGSTANKIYSLNVGKQTLTALGVTPISGMKISVVFYAGLVELGTLVYFFSDICTKYTPIRLYYMSRSGRILFKQAELVSIKKATKKTNEVQLGKGASNVNVWDRENFEVSNITNYSKTLNTNWISEAQSNVLDELWDSPFVWLFENNQYIPVKITDTNYEYKKLENEPLFNLPITVEYSQTETRQRAI